MTAATLESLLHRELPAARPAKEWFFVPALALLALVMWLQALRMRRGRGAPALA